MTDTSSPSLPACIFWDRHQTIESWRAWIHTYEDLIHSLHQCLGRLHPMRLEMIVTIAAIAIWSTWEQ